MSPDLNVKSILALFIILYHKKLKNVLKLLVIKQNCSLAFGNSEHAAVTVSFVVTTANRPVPSVAPPEKQNVRLKVMTASKFVN